MNAWPIPARGPAALLAFSVAETPVKTTCFFCGEEVLFGSRASRLDVVLRLCSRCPVDLEKREALRHGYAVGARAMTEPEAPFVEVSHFASPYMARNWALHAVWKRGWWSALWTLDENPRAVASRLRLDVGLGIYRPSGAPVPTKKPEGGVG